MKNVWSIILYLCFVFVLFLGMACSDEDDSAGPEISLNKEELFLEIGKSERLTASFNPVDAPNQAHTWVSNNTSVAKVDETGNVTGVSVGDAIVVVKALDGGKTAKCYVKIVDKVIPVTGVSIDGDEFELVVGEKMRLDVTIYPSTASNSKVTWTVEDENIAAVNNGGEVVALNVGETVIKVTTDDGKKTASCKVKVIDRGVKFSQMEVLNVTSNSALIQGNIKPAGVEIEEKGLCYGIKQNSTLDDTKIQLKGDENSCQIGGLKAETTYYARFYAIVDGVVKYGDQLVFETLQPVDFVAPEFTDVTFYSAVVKGTISSNGSTLKETGIVYSVKPLPTIADQKIEVSNEIEYTLYELEADTKYYVRFYAIIGEEVYYSEESELLTNEKMVTHFEATNVYEDELYVVSVTPRGCEAGVDVCYGTSPQPTVTDNVAKAYFREYDGKLGLSIKGLQENTTYYLRSYYKMGNKFIYNDDEVELNTIGEKNIWVGSCSSRLYRYAYYNFSYESSVLIKTVLEGEFYHNAGNYFVSKSDPLTADNKTQEVYFSGDTRLIFQTLYRYEGYSSRVTFNPRPREIIHVPTGVRYYLNIPDSSSEYSKENLFNKDEIDYDK